MQRFLAGLLMIPVLAVLTGVAGCGKDDKPVPRTGVKLPPVDGGGGQAAGGKKTMVKPGSSTIVGRVVYDGAPPKPASLLPTMTAHADNATCLAGEDVEKIDQTWLIGKDGGVANVVIWLNPPAGSEFEVIKTAGDVELDQPHCVYIPHVVLIKPGQNLLIKNSANVLHNTNLSVDTFANPKGFGQAIPPKQSAKVTLNPQGSVINVGCQFHAWMSAKIWALPHQYAAITKEDGTFKIENVPEGELSLVAWHESPGFFHGGKKGAKITIKAGEYKVGDLKVSAN